MKLISYRLILMIFLFLFLFQGCIKNKEEKQVNKINEIYKVQLNYQKYYGIVKAQNIINLSFETNGYITYNPYTIGDFVKKGTLLAKNDSILYDIKFQEQNQKLQEAKIKADRQNKYYKRMNILHNSGAISDNDWEDAYYNLKTSIKEIEIQSQSMKYYKKLIEYSKIYAPTSGYILDKFLTKGEFANVGQKVISMIDSNETQIEVMVDYILAQKLKINSEVMILKNNNQYKGKIKHISKSSLNSGGYLIKIYLDKFYKELTNGENVDVIFNETKKIIIPIKYIFFENKNTFVYLKNKGKIKIKTGQIQRENIEILEGLKDKDEIIKYKK